MRRVKLKRLLLPYGLEFHRERALLDMMIVSSDKSQNSTNH
jgi:hypothetical protein